MGRYGVDLDLTEVIGDIIDCTSKQREKYLVHWCLLKFSGHEVELMKVLSQVFPELTKQLLRFYEKRVEDYRDSMRINKLFGFRTQSSIENEAVRRAWEDTKAMLQEVSMAKDEGVKGLIEEHKEILKRLCDTMVELVMKENPTPNLDLDGIRKFLEGEKP